MAFSPVWILFLSVAFLIPAYASSDESHITELLERCEEFEISAENCSEMEVLKKMQIGKRLISFEEQKRLEEQQNQFRNSMYMIGIGAAAAGATAFLTLRRLKK